MAIELDFKMIAIIVIAVIAIVLGSSIYFTITTPAGQTGLAGLGLSIMNAIAAPFIALGNGISHFFSSLFGGIGKWFTSHL